MPLLKIAEVKAYVQRAITAAFSKVDFSEETFEVDSCYINKDDIPNRDFKMYGAIEGTFVKSKHKSILPKGEGAIRPFDSNVRRYPVRGELVTVKEINGRHYYSTTVNVKGSPNENTAKGASSIGSNVETVQEKMGDTFERNIDIKPVSCCEGEIVYEGRFGNSIKLGLNHKNNSPNIKLRAGQGETSELPLEPVNENIETDSSSIYLTTDESVEFDGESVTGKKILIKSDGIFIKGSGENGEVRVIGDQSINLNSDQIKIGNGANQPVVRGDDLKSFLNDFLTDLDITFTNAMAAITPAGVIVTGGGPAAAPFKAGIIALQTKLANNTMLSNKVKTT